MKFIGLIGCGRWGENLMRNFLELGALRAVCDRNEHTLKKITSNYPLIRTHTNYRHLLDDSSLDAVVIATPASTHHEIALQAMRAGKHVYIEKPLARTEFEAIELIQLSTQLNLVLMVGHLLLYHPAVNKLKRLIADGELGEIRFVNSDRRNFALQRIDTNVILDLAPHDISMMSYLLGEESAELVEAAGFSTSRDGIIDVAHLDLKFGQCVYAHVHNSWIDPQKQCLLTVHGSKKTAVLNDTRQERKLELYSVTPDGQVACEQPIYPQDEPLRLECQHFLECLSSGGQPLSDGIGGYKVVSILERADRIIRSRSL